MSWQCPKCGGGQRETGELRAHGGFWSSAFDVSTRRFSYIACQQCGYTEFYKADLTASSKVFDFLVGG